jgi:hypothetical protein
MLDPNARLPAILPQSRFGERPTSVGTLMDMAAKPVTLQALFLLGAAVRAVGPHIPPSLAALAEQLLESLTAIERS